MTHQELSALQDQGDGNEEVQVPKRTRAAKSRPKAPTARNSGVILIGEHVFEQSKAIRRKAMLKALRPGEPPLGSLTSEEQSWLTTAFSYLNRIYENREAGRPGNNAFCIFVVGNVYVQFLAPWDAEKLVCEAVSAKSFPEVAGILGAAGDKVLRRLGFMPPEISPNYSQEIKIKDVKDLSYAARLAFRVLKQAYRVVDFSSATFKERIPSKSERRLFSRVRFMGRKAKGDCASSRWPAARTGIRCMNRTGS